MKQAAKRGRFITFEGGEGAGKSTQIRLLANNLKKLGFDVTMTREPGGSPYAETLRRILLSGAAKALGSSGEAVLFAAARSDHVDTVVRPTLRAGGWVLCDRFIDSTRVYQGLDGETEPEVIRALERLAIDGLMPDLTLIIDIDAAIGLDRARSWGRAHGTDFDRFENDELETHQKRRDAFLKLAEEEPDRCRVVDGSQSPDSVAREIWRIVAETFQIADRGRLDTVRT